MEEKTVSKTKRIEDLTIQDIFDMEFLQQFQDNFALSVGMTSITVDINGTPVTRPSRFTDFCMK
ncbi:MAG: PocR ligand-binding domain-containing protein, partial [Selenomonadaceae bacterium]